MEQPHNSSSNTMHVECWKSDSAGDIPTAEVAGLLRALKEQVSAAKSEVPPDFRISTHVHQAFYSRSERQDVKSNWLGALDKLTGGIQGRCKLCSWCRVIIHSLFLKVNAADGPCLLGWYLDRRRRFIIYGSRAGSTTRCRAVMISGSVVRA